MTKTRDEVVEILDSTLRKYDHETMYAHYDGRANAAYDALLSAGVIRPHVGDDALRDFAQSVMAIPDECGLAHVPAIKLGAALALGIPYEMPKDKDDTLVAALSNKPAQMGDELAHNTKKGLDGIASIIRDEAKLSPNKTRKVHVTQKWVNGELVSSDFVVDSQEPAQMGEWDMVTIILNEMSGRDWRNTSLRELATDIARALARHQARLKGEG